VDGEKWGLGVIGRWDETSDRRPFWRRKKGERKWWGGLINLHGNEIKWIYIAGRKWGLRWLFFFFFFFF
jgi:hypothetical protein